MSKEILTVFENKFDFEVDVNLAKMIIRFVRSYETREPNSLAFNSPYLGLHKCFFLTKDRDDFLSIFNYDDSELSREIKSFVSRNSVFGVSKNEYKNYVKSSVINDAKTIVGITAKDLRKIISNVTSIDSNFIVASDPFNIFITFLIHKILTSKLPSELKYETAICALMLLQYKFFTSLVNHRFKYRPDEATMVAMYESLTNKFDIKQFGTWRNVLIERATQFIQKNSIHYSTFINYDDDKKIIYIITDVQTRIRNQINIVTTEFMKIKEAGDKIGSYSAIGKDIDGNKTIMDADSGFDMMLASIYNDVLSVPRLLDEQAVLLVSKLFGAVNISKMRSVLVAFSEYAVKQARSGKSMLIEEDNGRILLVGAQVLIQNLIQKTYRYCINTGVNMSKPIEIIKATKDVYSSSRIADEGIVQVRESVAKLMLEIQDSRRETTLSSLRIAFVVYFVVISLKYLK